MPKSMRNSNIMCDSAVVFLVALVCCHSSGVSHAQSHYYTISRGSGVRSRVSSDGGMLDTLQRGHDGLLVQLNTLSDAIKEDELKLNNVFYKLGRHDTDIQTNTAVQFSLKSSTRKLEAKLNKQSFNLDFLRRHVLELKRGVVGGAGTARTVKDLQATVSELQQSLVRALFRTEILENKTRTLEQSQRRPVHYSPGIDNNNIYYASRTPKTTYFYLDEDIIEGVCDESSGWVSSPEGGCWLVGDGEDVTTFPAAVASCANKGGVLAQLPDNNKQWPRAVRNSIKEKNGESYWTSGTCAFTPGVWTFLFTGDTVAGHQWNNGQHPGSRTSNRNNCAAMTPSGLVAMSCTAQLPYVCAKL